MKIWIIAKEQFFESDGNTRFLETAEQMDIDLKLIAPENFEIIATREGSKSIYIDRQEVKKLPDCVIPRTGSGTTYFASAVIRHLERLGLLVLNSSESILLAKDKMATVQKLAAAGIPVPKTILAKLPLDLDLIGKEFGFPLILKKISGTEGKGIVLCKDLAQLRDTSELLDPNWNIILQECIEDSLGKDVRVMVIGGRAIGAMLRTASQGTFKANYSAGGSVEKCGLTPEMEWLAVESARITGLDIAGVDLLFDKDSFRVCEVNSAPYFNGFEKATGQNVPREIFNFARLKTEKLK